MLSVAYHFPQPIVFFTDVMNVTRTLVLSFPTSAAHRTELVQYLMTQRERNSLARENNARTDSYTLGEMRTSWFTFFTFWILYKLMHSYI